MKISKQRPGSRGAILVFALMLGGMAAIGLAIWVSVLGARSRYVEECQKSSRARLAAVNGRIIAARHVRNQVLTESADATLPSRGLGYSGSLSVATDRYSSGGMDITSTWSGSILSSNVPGVGVNRLSWANGPGFGLRDGTNTGMDLNAKIITERDQRNYRVQARSVTPALAGELLTVHAASAGFSSPVIAGNISVHGGAAVWPGANGAVAPTVTWDRPYQTASAKQSGRSDLPSNYFVKSWTWAPAGVPEGVTTGTASGQLNTIWSTASTGNSLRHKAEQGVTDLATITYHGDVTRDTSSVNGVVVDGPSRKVTVDLSSYSLNKLIIDNVQTLELTGQIDLTKWNEADGYSVILIVVNQNTGSPIALQNINFRYKNNRRIHLAVKKADSQSAVNLNFPDLVGITPPQWRLMLTLEGTPATVSMGAGTVLNINGAITTNCSFTGPTGTGQSLHLYQESSPLFLKALMPRRVWVESYRID